MMRLRAWTYHFNGIFISRHKLHIMGMLIVLSYRVISIIWEMKKQKMRQRSILCHPWVYHGFDTIKLAFAVYSSKLLSFALHIHRCAAIRNKSDQKWYTNLPSFNFDTRSSGKDRNLYSLILLRLVLRINKFFFSGRENGLNSRCICVSMVF